MAHVVEALDPSRELLYLHQRVASGAWFLHRGKSFEEKLLRAAAQEKGEDL